VEIYRNEGVHLDVEVGDAPVLVQVDPGQIEEVVVNLIGNALDVTSRGSVSRSTRGTSGWRGDYRIDMGRRIRKEDLAQNSSIPSSRSRAGAPGVGLGLLMSKQIVRRTEARSRSRRDPR